MGIAASTPSVVWQVPLKLSPFRPVKETSLLSLLPLQAAMASGGGPGGLPPSMEDALLDDEAAVAARLKQVQSASRQARSRAKCMVRLRVMG